MTSTYSPFAAQRLADTPGPSKRCVIFHWIGQPFSTCDACSRPEREHLYHPPYGTSPTLFRIKQWDQWQQVWRWERVGGYINRSVLR